MTLSATLTKPQLVEEAKARGIEVTEKTTRNDLFALIAAFDEEATEAEVIDGEAVEEEVEPSTEVVLHTVEAKELEIREERAQQPGPTNVLPSPAEWEATMVMARTIAETTFVPRAYRGNPEAVVAGILYGREIGLGPMVALQKVHIIEGKPSLAAEEMLAQMRRGGVIILASESTRDRAWIHARRRDTGEEAEVEWTIQDAIEAGLTSKDNWSKYCVDMLWARCVGRLCRRLGSDLVGGMVYAKEEMEDWDDGGYGGSGYSTATRAEEPFDPKKKALPGAQTDWASVMTMLKDVDAAIPWADVIQQATVGVYGEAASDLKSQNAQVKNEVFARTSNAAVRVSEYFENETFLSEESVQKAFAEMFEGFTVTLPKHEADIDVPAVVEAAKESDEATNSGLAPEGAAEDAGDDEPAPLTGQSPLPADDSIEF